MEDFEKEKEELKLQMAKDHKDQERKLKDKFQNILDQKLSEIARINRDLQVCQAQLKQQKTQNSLLIEKQNQLQFEFSQSALGQNSDGGPLKIRTQSPNSHTSTNSGKKVKSLKIGKSLNAKSPYLNDCFNKLKIGQNTSHGSVSSGMDPSKSTQSKMSNQSTRKASIDDANRSFGRSSNGGRTTSGDRVLKLKINSSKGQKDKNQKIIANIQRIRQGGSQTSTQITNLTNG